MMWVLMSYGWVLVPYNPNVFVRQHVGRIAKGKGNCLKGWRRLDDGKGKGNGNVKGKVKGHLSRPTVREIVGRVDELAQVVGVDDHEHEQEQVDETVGVDKHEQGDETVGVDEHEHVDNIVGVDEHEHVDNIVVVDEHQAASDRASRELGRVLASFQEDRVLHYMSSMFGIDGHNHNYRT
jgi:hypothetical protein